MWPRSSTPVSQQDPALYSVDLGTHPRLAWKHELTQWAPQCTTTDPGSNGYCDADVAAVGEAHMVVQVKPNKGVEELVGVDLTTGAFAWRRALPDGTTSTCRPGRTNLWCIAVTSTPQPSPTDADQFQATEPAGPAQLMSIDADTGRTKGSAILGSSGVHDFLATDPDFVLVSNQSSDTSDSGDASGAGDSSDFNADSQDGQAPTTAPMDVQRFDVNAVAGWRSTVPKGVTTAGFGAPVLQADGIDYVGYLAGSDGQGIGFSTSDGSLRKLPGGAAVALYRGHVVTEGKQSTLAIDGHNLHGESVVPMAHDDSTGIPLVTMAKDDGSVDASQLHEADPPYKIVRTVPGLASAYCGGRLFTQSMAQVVDAPADDADQYNQTPQIDTLRAIDPKSGRVAWHTEMEAGEFVICSGSDVAVGAPGKIVGFAIDSGAKKWSVSVPDDLMFSGWTQSGVLLEQFGENAARTFAYLSR